MATNADDLRLEELELEIERGLKSFFCVGLALGQIRENKLYKSSGYKNFNVYCQKRWGMARRNADRLIKAAGVVKNLIELPTDDLALIEELKSESNWSHFLGEVNFPLPQNESQMRPLVGYEAEDQRTIWRLSTSKTGGVAPPAKVVKQTANEVMEERKQTSDEKDTLADLEVGDICVIQPGDETDLKPYSGYWCVIKYCRDSGYDVDVYDRTLTLVKPEYLLKLECSQEQKGAGILLMSRMQSIASVETVSFLINSCLVTLSRGRDFNLSDRDEEILSFIENLLGTINNR